MILCYRTKQICQDAQQKKKKKKIFIISLLYTNKIIDKYISTYIIVIIRLIKEYVHTYIRFL